MNWFEKILAGLNGKMEMPLAYGWFHLMCWFLVIVLTVTLVMLAIRYRKDDAKIAKITRIVVLTYSILGIVLEIYKQLNFSFTPTEDGGVWDYRWYAFPFQFCSTPMYIGLIAGCLKKGKFQEYLYSYLATFALFAGLCVMIYPGDVFTRTVGINIQTMVCHGGMVVMGIYLLFSGMVKLEWKTIFKALSVFAVLVCIADVFNIIYHFAGGTETCNLFFISPYFPCTLPILSMIYEVVPYPVFLIIYIIGFTLAAFVMLAVAIGIDRLIKHEKKIKVWHGLEDDAVMDKIFDAMKNLE